MNLFARVLTVGAITIGMCSAPAGAHSKRQHAPAPSTQPVSHNLPADASFNASKGYKLDAGPYEAGEVDRTLERADKTVLPIKVRYPRAATGPLPVLVFSHGAGGAGDAFADLTTHLATHGYVVILPTHADSIKLRRQQGEKNPGRMLLDRGELVRKVKPFERAADCTLILDSLAEIEQGIEGLRSAEGAGKLDRERLAIGGHSAGALTSQVAIGVKCRRAGNLSLTSYADPRFKAAVLVSGQGTVNRMLTDQSWSDLEKPLLVITGSEDNLSLTGETAASRREPYEKARAGGKYLVFIEGATHSSYQGKSAIDRLDRNPATDLPMITRVTTSSVLAFLDAHVVGDAGAVEYLAGTGLVELARGKVEYQHK